MNDLGRNLAWGNSAAEKAATPPSQTLVNVCGEMATLYDELQALNLEISQIEAALENRRDQRRELSARLARVSQNIHDEMQRSTEQYLEVTPLKVGGIHGSLNR